jgi:hypothetical protein
VSSCAASSEGSDARRRASASDSGVAVDVVVVEDAIGEATVSRRCCRKAVTSVRSSGMVRL